MQEKQSLVPDRVCGECTACCVALQIDTENFKKRFDQPCPHLEPGQGCGIYSTRFDICRNWYCGWRYMAQLGEEWRPDRCRVIVMREEGPPSRLVLHPLENPLWTLTSGPIYEFVEQCLNESVPLAISISTGKGFASAAIDLNEPIATALRIGVFRTARSALAHMIKFAAQVDTAPAPEQPADEPDQATEEPE